jgi:hypothetical protein
MFCIVGCIQQYIETNFDRATTTGTLLNRLGGPVRLSIKTSLEIKTENILHQLMLAASQQKQPSHLEANELAFCWGLYLAPALGVRLC